MMPKLYYSYEQYSHGYAHLNVFDIRNANMRNSRVMISLQKLGLPLGYHPFLLTDLNEIFQWCTNHFLNNELKYRKSICFFV